MKIIKVYYKGTCQEFNASDGTTEEEIFKLMKRIFRIKEDIYDFFLQDSEGRVLIMPKIMPEELSVYLYVRSNDGIPDISNKNVNEKSVSTENINKEEEGNDSFFNFNRLKLFTFFKCMWTDVFDGIRNGDHFTISITKNKTFIIFV